MELGPVEVVVFALPGEGLDAAVLTELGALVAGGTVRILDAVLARRDEDGTLSVTELADAPSWDDLSGLVDHLEGLLAEDDIEELTSGLAAGSQGLVIAFENTWVVPLLTAVRGVGGSVLGEVAVADVVVQEIVDTVPDEEEDR
ncbi:MAG: DUF6325 family protein [Propionicimonas sp.]|uniref:DUF6325 family protein n=1 Tax=Propionicimonas sp. TaxID=1955623 RepID=UPI003D0A91F8